MPALVTRDEPDSVQQAWQLPIGLEGLTKTVIPGLGQDPLAGLLRTAEQLQVAEILDGAGFSYLEVSGGGCFDSAVRRGVESPWERIRALKARTNRSFGPTSVS